MAIASRIPDRQAQTKYGEPAAILVRPRANKFPRFAPLLEADSRQGKSEFLKAQLNMRIDKFSEWLVYRVSQNLPLGVEEPEAHLYGITCAIFELRNLEPGLHTTSMLRSSFRQAISAAIEKAGAENKRPSQPDSATPEVSRICMGIIMDALYADVAVVGGEAAPVAAHNVS
jgi:hypothetical protein